MDKQQHSRELALIEKYYLPILSLYTLDSIRHEVIRRSEVKINQKNCCRNEERKKKFPLGWLLKIANSHYPTSFAVPIINDML
jgi:hypothetical protein